jgi:hypothetical protein
MQSVQKVLQAQAQYCDEFVTEAHSVALAVGQTVDVCLKKMEGLKSVTGL